MSTESTLSNDQTKLLQVHERHNHDLSIVDAQMLEATGIFLLDFQSAPVLCTLSTSVHQLNKSCGEQKAVKTNKRFINSKISRKKQQTPAS